MIVNRWLRIQVMVLSSLVEVKGYLEKDYIIDFNIHRLEILFTLNKVFFTFYRCFIGVYLRVL